MCVRGKLMNEITILFIDRTYTIFYVLVILYIILLEIGVKHFTKKKMEK